MVSPSNHEFVLLGQPKNDKPPFDKCRMGNKVAAGP
jgi:hypothetical protein